jgi:hypothetical protein
LQEKQKHLEIIEENFEGKDIIFKSEEDLEITEDESLDDEKMKIKPIFNKFNESRSAQVVKTKSIERNST